MEHFVNLVHAIAWPVAAIWLGYIFRGEIRKLLGRVSALKYKDLEASFEKELAAAETEAQKILPPKTTSQSNLAEPIYPQPYDERYEQLLRIADESPRAALLEAWVEVEAALTESAEEFMSGSARRVIPRKLMLDLINNGKYPKTVLPLFEDLRRLRNEAAHTPEFEPTNRQTRRYLQMAIELSLTFRQLNVGN